MDGVGACATFEELQSAGFTCHRGSMRRPSHFLVDRYRERGELSYGWELDMSKFYVL